jgi:hypothetical protein
VDLRLSMLSARGRTTANPISPGSHGPSWHHLLSESALHAVPLYPRRKGKKHSIPIARVPAQFNAFYRQRSGSGLRPSLKVYRAGGLPIESWTLCPAKIGAEAVPLHNCAALN